MLSSFPLDLKKTDENIQILNVENKQTHDVFVFAASGENITILKYNSALFFKDQLTFPKTVNKLLVGYSFGEDGNPYLYWASEDFKNIIAVKYSLENKTVKMVKFDFPSIPNYIVTNFQENNTFYVLSKYEDQQVLIVHTFKNGIVEKKEFDFSSFDFKNRNAQLITFNKVVDENPIEKIDADDFTPLDKSAQKSKIYLKNNHLILTLDYNTKNTHVFDMDLENQTIKEKSFPQPLIDKSNNVSNSFLVDDKLYQINANKYVIVAEIKDYNSGQILKTVSTLKNDTINFKNSPLFLLTDSRRPVELKKTGDFLNRLAFLNIGLTAFKNKQNTFITIGGSPKEEEYYNIYGNFPQTYNSQSVYFESVLNNNLDFIKEPQQPFAADNIYYFLGLQKRAAFQNIFKFKDYYILGYYDFTSKQFIMRKFNDGFMPEENTNPIINKAVFSKPTSFGEIKTR
ncbi:hypothetical protein [Flavobacterium sp. ACN6]|uniref:hypothetical protein n=1 Tax=Flavobacterium sp. ACN6 TaxID=1920426 RepID=UPI00209BE6BB|nr:hypothetical protein [Flavobacterium sp. ACN6]